MPNVTACNDSSVVLTMLLLGLLLLLLLLPALLSVASLAACSKHDSHVAFKKEVNLNAFVGLAMINPTLLYNLSG